jgi:hypothetical protein
MGDGCSNNNFMRGGVMAYKPEKPKWSLIQPLMLEIEQVVMLLTDGCRDHEDFGWMNEPVEEDYDAVMRHVSKMGEYDESGYLHEVHAIARLLFRLHKIRKGSDRLGDIVAIDGGE